MFKSNYINLKNNDVLVKDGDDYVKVIGILKNNSVEKWIDIELRNGSHLTVTEDHPFLTEETGKTIAIDLLIGQNLIQEDNSLIAIKDIKKINKTMDSYDLETESDHFNFNGIRSHNCRTANGFDVNGLGQLKDGRGNIAPSTIILPTLAMEANQDVETFIELLDRKLHECKDSLIDRFNYIASQSPDAAKFMWENRLMEGYTPAEGIKSALKHGTLAIGMLGLNETLELLIGKNHTTKEGMQLAKRICKLYKDRCAEFKEQYKLNFGVYYTPAENLCHTAMKKFKDKYGTIKNVSDKDYFTNSIHVPVYEQIDIFRKIDIESQLTGYSSAGCITYIELDSSAKNNPKALEKIVNYAMDKDIPYFAINLPNDTCMNCGYTDDLDDTCPQCGGKEIQRLRRVTGYLTGNYLTAFNKGKQQEVEQRFKHSKITKDFT